MFREGDQPFANYPTVEVRSLRGIRSRDTTPEIKTEEQTIQVKIMLKYVRTNELEEADLEAIESQILFLLESATIETGSFFFQSKQWDRRIRDEPYGLDSVLRFTFREIFPNTA